MARSLAQTIQVQDERSKVVVGQITNYLNDLQRKLSYLARVRGLRLTPTAQRNLLEGLTRHNDAYEMLAVLDREGKVVSSVIPFKGTELENFANSALFQRAYRPGARRFTDRHIAVFSQVQYTSQSKSLRYSLFHY